MFFINPFYPQAVLQGRNNHPALPMGEKIDQRRDCDKTYSVKIRWKKPSQSEQQDGHDRDNREALQKIEGPHLSKIVHKGRQRKIKRQCSQVRQIMYFFQFIRSTIKSWNREYGSIFSHKFEGKIQCDEVWSFDD